MTGPRVMNLAVLLLSTGVFAEDWRAEDFAFGFTIEAEAEDAGPILELELSDAV